MEIFIVWYINFNSDTEFVSAHSSREKAQERIDKYSKSDQEAFYIDSYALDSEKF